MNFDLCIDISGNTVIIFYFIYGYSTNNKLSCETDS